MSSHPPAFPPLHYTTDRGIHHMLFDAADAHPQRIAMRFGNEVTTYREFDGLANAFGSLLADRGVRVGNRVAMMASNRPEFALAVYGILGLGASVVMISPAWKEAEIDHAAGLTQPCLSICDGTTDERLPESSNVLHLDRDNVFDDLMRRSGRRPQIDADWDATEAVLVFSSGTTGLPKAVRHTHASVGAATMHWASALGLSPDDRFQMTTPPFHILGLLNLFASVSAASSIRLHARFDLDEVLRYIEADQVTLEMVVAPIALAMANHPDIERYDLSSLRYIMWGATPVTVSVAERVTERTGVRFLPAYGASEVPVITSNPINRPDTWRLDSAGLPIHDLQMRIADLESGEVLGSGGVGEIQVKSPSAMTGYLPEEADEDAFVDGWYRTGDVGWIDADGWLQITDRVKEMIKVKGFQVAPAEVEAVLHGHDDVVDCAVFGVPDEAAGEIVVAAVQLAPDATSTEADLRALIIDRLASYKQVSRLEFVDEIPRLPSGKVLRRTLRERYSGDQGE